MKKILPSLIAITLCAQADFFHEQDKQAHMAVSVPFGAIGALACKGDKAFNLDGWKAIMCGTAIGMIPGIVKEARDQHNYNGWDNRDLAADAIGSFVGAVSTITIYRFNSGDW